MRRNPFFSFQGIILCPLAAVAVLSIGVFDADCRAKGKAEVYADSDSSDRITREALIKRCSFIAENIDLRSTAGNRQANIIRSLLASVKNGVAARIEFEYPFDEAVFPPEFIPPMFVWNDSLSGSDTWLIDVAFPDGGRLAVLAPKNPLPEPVLDQQCLALTFPENPPYPPYKAPDTNWTPPDTVWKTIKTLTTEKYAEIAVYGFNSASPDRVLSAGKVRIGTSRDPVGAPVFYRDVPMIGVRRALTDELAGVIQPLPVKAQDLIMWRLRDVSKSENRIVLRDMPTCANCHSFSADGSTMGMDIDGPAGDKGAYAIVKIQPDMVIEKKDIISWNYRYKKKFKGQTKTIGFSSQVSPDGRYAVTTVNEQLFLSGFTDHKFVQVFYPTRGLLAYYSVEEDDIHLLPGADDPDYVHTDVVWTPDGSSLIFAGAKAREANITGRPRPTYACDPNETPIQYDLYRISFNGGSGGTKELIPGASNNGMSNTFPKVSPDGRWIVFVTCANGQLMRPDSRLRIIPTTGGNAREMRCNLSLMNSWHSFSPNGRWMVFSSKGMSPYTRLFLTHIDENGNDTPPVLIPDSTAPNRSVNIPEFVNIAYDSLRTIDVPAVSFYRHRREAMNLTNAGKFKEALAELEIALRENQDDSMVIWEIYNGMGEVYNRFGYRDDAIECWKKAIEVLPDISTAPYILIGINRASMKLYKDADEYFLKALALNPSLAQALYYRALMKIDESARDFYNPGEAISLALLANEKTANREWYIQELLGWAYAADGRLPEALTAMERALELVKPHKIPEWTKHIEEKIALYKEGKAK